MRSLLVCVCVCFALACFDGASARAQSQPPSSGPSIEEFGVGDAQFRVVVSGAPVIGYPLAIEIEGGPPFAGACFAVGLFGEPLPTPFGFSIFPQQFGVVTITLDERGGFDSLVSIGALPASLADVPIVVQGFVIDPASPRLIRASRPVSVRVGDSVAARPRVDPIAGVSAGGLTRNLQVLVRGEGRIAGDFVRIEGGVSPVVTTIGQDRRFEATVALRTNAVNRLDVRELFPGVVAGPALSFEVVQDLTPPAVFIDFPIAGAVIGTPTVTVTGRVSDTLSGFAGLGVSVNGRPGFVNVGIGTNGTFEVPDVPLGAGGVVTLRAMATDSLGNAAASEMLVSHVPTNGARLIALGGNHQQGEVGDVLAQPLGVRLQFVDGAPWVGRPVKFRVVQSDGQLATPGSTARELTVLTGLDGTASVEWSLGSDAGCGNQRVEVTSPQVAEPVWFCASAIAVTADRIHVGSGDGQVVRAGEQAPEPLRVWVNDGCNGIGGVPVTFEARDGCTLETLDGATRGASIVAITGATGHAEVRAICAANAGRQSVIANFAGNPGLPATFVLRALAADLAATRFTGRVFDNSSQPLGGVGCRLTFDDGTSLFTSTDVEGDFAFEAILTSGRARLDVIGASTTTIAGQPFDRNTIEFPSVAYDLVVYENVDNILPQPVLLPRLDVLRRESFDGTRDVVLTVAGIEGVRIDVPRTTRVAHPALGIASPANPIALSISQVHTDDIPVTFPDGAAPPFAWTIQPGGTTFDPPLAIEMPNMAGLAPGAVGYFLTFDDDVGEFLIVATGAVSEDGSVLRTLPGQGTIKAGWGGVCPPYPRTAEVENCPDLEIWELSDSTANLAMEIASLLGRTSAALQCARSITTSVDAALAFYNVARSDGQLTQAEASDAGTLFTSIDSAIIECVGVLSAIRRDVDSAASRTADIARAIPAAIGAAQASGCVTGLSGIALAIVEQLARITQQMANLAADLAAKESLTTTASQELDQLIDLLTDFVSHGTGQPTLGQLDAALGDFTASFTASFALDPAIESVIAQLPAVKQLEDDATSLRDALAWPEAANAEVTIGTRRTVAHAGGGFGVTGLSATSEFARLRIEQRQGGVVIESGARYLTLVANQRLVIDTPIRLQPGPLRDTVAISVGTNPVGFDSIGQTGITNVIAHFSDGTQSSVQGANDGVSYSSSRPDVATIDGAGIITARGPGLASVTVRKDGVTASAQVVVEITGTSTTIRGNVVDARGAPVVAARVETSAGFAGITDANGGFEIGGHPTQLHHVDIRASSNSAGTEKLGFMLDVALEQRGITQVGAITIDIDTDGDGLPDIYERQIHATNPLLADTDGDGLDDGFEVFVSDTDPARADSDGDGLSDRAEGILGTDRRRPDLLTRLVGTTRFTDGSLAVGARVTVEGVLPAFYQAISDASGTFVLENWPVSLVPLRLVARGTDATSMPRIGHLEVATLLGGPTSRVDDIVLASFDAEQIYPGAVYGVGVNPFSIVLGDLNGDGALDLATANVRSNDVSVLLGDGVGGFGTQRRFPVGNSPYSIALGDLDGDGALDLATANWESNDVAVLLGDGLGGFGMQQRFEVGTNPRSIALCDLNGDGALDLAVVNESSHDVSVLSGDGVGGFGTQQRFAVGTRPLVIAVGDLNGDGAPDLATSNRASADVTVLWGDGVGGFGTQQRLAFAATPISIVLGDLNGDGALDLAAATSIDVSVLPSDGAGGFGALRRFVAGSCPWSIALGDANGDGALDLVTANVVSHDVSLLLGDGAGGFGMPHPFAVGISPWSIVLGDFSGDGALDLATANFGSNDVSVLLGDGEGVYGTQQRFGVEARPLSFALGDLNGDGALDLATAINTLDVSVRLGDGVGGFEAQRRYTVGSPATSIALGDVDGDGELDLAMTNFSPNDVSVLSGDGLGGFGTPRRFAVGARPLAIALGDLNGDSALDLATANWNSNDVSVLAGDGVGGLGTQQRFEVGARPWSIALGDLNGDGALDLVTTNRDSHDVSVLLGDGVGRFEAQQRFAVGAWPISIALGDLNRDGALDLATANEFSSDVSVLSGDGLGGFGPQQRFAVGDGPISIALGDLNGDRALDLATANSLSNDVSVLLNQQ